LWFSDNFSRAVSYTQVREQRIDERKDAIQKMDSEMDERFEVAKELFE